MDKVLFEAMRSKKDFEHSGKRVAERLRGPYFDKREGKLGGKIA